MYEDFLTVKETRQIIRLGETKIYELLNEGKIKAIKVGRKTLVPRSSLQAFIDSQPSYSQEA
jgi:excisionase family DNA binding protein